MIPLKDKIRAMVYNPYRRKYATCLQCGGDINYGEYYYDVGGGDKVHDRCLTDYAQDTYQISQAGMDWYNEDY